MNDLINFNYTDVVGTKRLNYDIYLLCLKEK